LGGRLRYRIAIRSVTCNKNLIAIEHDRGIRIWFRASLGFDNKNALFGEHDMVKVEFITGDVVEYPSAVDAEGFEKLSDGAFTVPSQPQVP